MISEVVNTLFLTFLASEYLVANDQGSGGGIRSDLWHTGTNRSKVLSFLSSAAVVVFINIIDRVSGARTLANQVFETFVHLPRVILSAFAYLFALYWDIRRRLPHVKFRQLASRSAWAFAKVLPAYPFLAVLISFAFMFIINFWEALQLPMELLNAPIYYGTLYGPFAWVYVSVKRNVISEATSLPISYVLDHR